MQTIQTRPTGSLAPTVDDVPGKPRRRVFPGWTMVGVAAAGQYLSAPGQSYSVAAFKDPMRADLGLSETDYSLAYGFATVLSACLLPMVGRLVDRLGARVMLPLIASGLGCGCFLMSTVDSLGSLYLSFSLVRCLGQGALSLASVWLVGEWFERRRGMATAVAGLGGGLSVMTVPLINNWLIMHYGWESAWVVLALVVWAVLIIPAVLIVRNRPEDLGLQPDGWETLPQSADDEVGEEDSSETYVSVDSWTPGEVLRDATFWKLLSVPATAGLVGTGLVFHQVALLGQHGLSSMSALGLMTVQAGFATLLTFPAGWLTDRIASRYLLAAAMSALAAANLLVLSMPAQWMAVVYAMLLGFHGSIMRSTATVVWINYYGRGHQGAVRGVAWSAMILASSLGPLPLALSIDYWGTYTPALAVFLVLPVISAGIVWTARAPKRITSGIG
ncbi:MAG: MFS transporter [Planctomycetaceae bacterium]